MIFVTVGTHEQPFDRLIHEMDRLIGSGLIKEEVFIQRGINSIVPQNCPSAELLSYPDMMKMVDKGRIIICHGGPGSIMVPLSKGKVPIMVPRQARYREHVDGHQVSFVRWLEAQKRVIAVYDVKELQGSIENYDTLSRALSHYHTSKENTEQLVANLRRYCLEIIT